MRRYVTLLILLLMLLQDYNGMAQLMWRYDPAEPVVCHYKTENRRDHVGVSEKFKTFRNAAAGRVKTAVIQVEYVNFPADNKAKDAFEYAIQIWESELTSSIPIRIRAEWVDLDAGVIAQAIWGSAYANFGTEQHMNTYYPVALAEKIAGKELNDPEEPDIVASFNRNIAWYLGTDGLTPDGKMDMVTIVLHEIAHGLGFTDTYTVKDGEGSVGLPNGSIPVPFIFDLFVENASGDNLVHQFESPSISLATALQSTDLFFDGPMSTVALSGQKAELFAPATFDKGSSISHLDEARFSGSEDANRLMTPHISAAESIHDPGSLLRGMFSDIGWVYTAIDHQPLKDTERKDGQPYPIAATIRSDNGYDSDRVELHYSTNGIDFTTVKMMPTGTADEFASFLPGTTGDLVYAYFISVVDVSDRVFSNPGKIGQPGDTPQQGTHVFNIGPDEEAPKIAHDPVTYIWEHESELVVIAEVTDNQGVAQAVLEYSVNDGPIQTQVMDLVPDTDTYSATIVFAALGRGDNVQYRILATDNAAQQNFSSMPAVGFYSVSVTGLMAARDSYTNDFNSGGSLDFFGNSFSITTPIGFDNPAIHTDHPYPNGSGTNNESNYTYQLQVPIRIDPGNPFIRFDEVVLVEPGEDGSVFGGTDFYDYVVVEGSADGGVSWFAFEPGYDCREEATWLSRYNSATEGDNSTAKGDGFLYRERTINMLENGKFISGDEVIIRFRLFADQLARGWGWTIDNLAIQSPVTDTELPLATDFQVYPVPMREELFIRLNAEAELIQIEIADLQGKIIFTETYLNRQDNVQEKTIDLRAINDGLYILNAKVDNRTYRRKILKVY